MNMNGNKNHAISQMVNALKKVQALQTDAPFSVSVVHNSSMIGEHTYRDYEVFCKSVKSPFSTFVEIDNFLRAPLFGETNQHTFEFLDQPKMQSFTTDTKFITTTTCYPEQPSCHLVRSAIHETIYLTKSNSMDRVEKQEKNSAKSTAKPLHTPKKSGKSRHINEANDYIKIRVPVVIGEYNIELCLEEEILFEEKVVRIKEVTNTIVLTNCHFIPTEFSESLRDGTYAASSGMLAIEGHILQHIKYSAIPARKRRGGKRQKRMKLHEKITLELIVQVMQEQAIQVNTNH